jgi:DNA-binding protein YbaB
MSTGPGTLRGGIEQALRVAREQQRRLSEVQKELAVLQVVGHSGDGLVNVTLDHTMKVTAIDINARAMRMNSYQLAEALQEALNAGYAECEERAAELMSTVVGDPDLIRGAVDGSVTASDWFKRFGVDIDAMFGR